MKFFNGSSPKIQVTAERALKNVIMGQVLAYISDNKNLFTDK